MKYAIGALLALGLGMGMVPVAAQSEADASPRSSPAPVFVSRCATGLAQMNHAAPRFYLSDAAVRDTICQCLAQPAPAVAAGERKVPDEVPDRFQHCVQQALATLRVEPLSPVALQVLRDALLPSPQGPGYVPPRLLVDRCKLPEYPAGAVRWEATGTSRLQFEVDASGRITDGWLVSSAGATAAHKLLDAAALLSLMQCRAEPAKLAGQPQPSAVMIEYVWRLQ